METYKTFEAQKQQVDAVDFELMQLTSAAKIKAVQREDKQMY